MSNTEETVYIAIDDYVDNVAVGLKQSVRKLGDLLVRAVDQRNAACAMLSRCIEHVPEELATEITTLIGNNQ